MTDINKLVWLDYWKGFAWSNVKAYFKENKSFAFVCVIMCFVTILDYISESTVGREELVHNMLRAWGVILPFVFACIAMPLTSIALPKVLYMSPMTEDERREFVKKKWRLAVLVPNVIWMIVGLFAGMDIWTAIFFIVHLVLLSEGLVFYRSKNAGQWEKAQEKAYGVYGIFFAIISIIVHIFATMTVVDYGTLGVVRLAVFIGIVILLELPLLYKLMTYKKILIAYVTNYEVTYDVGSY
ncbi:MAG: hypothetical protein IJ326_13080 [Lachnospiraceae bacterium]|nr:hypothetical protein [Lachnospiraceae bacterium]